MFVKLTYNSLKYMVVKLRYSCAQQQPTPPPPPPPQPEDYSQLRD